ncbi:MAG: hypothetical protein C0507_00095 [Cyanobacteria bacterium PR.3.49]|nr:hypothetical protein [Cyanobacteria bacterium PR.3.49]
MNYRGILMRFPSCLAGTLCLIQLVTFGLSNRNNAALAQGLYGAGDQIPLPRRHSNIYSRHSGTARQQATDAAPQNLTPEPTPLRQTANSSSRMAADTDLIVPATGQPGKKYSSPNTNSSPSITITAPPIQSIKPNSTTEKSSVSISDEAPLHDQDKTSDPWFCDDQKLKIMKKKITEETENIRQTPQRVNSYLARADGYLHVWNSQAAYDDSNRALELTQDKVLQAFAYTNRAEALLQMKKYHEAMTDLQRAISIDDENAEAIYFRGMARERLGQKELAIKDYLVARDLGFAPNGVKVNFEPYMTEIQRTIKSNWHPPKAGNTRKTTAVFRVLRNGQMENPRIDSESGTPETDAAALAALNASAPFPPLPKGSPRHVDISFNFDYNVNRNYPASTSYSREHELLKEDAVQKEKVAAAEKTGDDEQIIKALIEQGDQYRDRKNLSFAEADYKRAKTLIEKRGQNNIDNARILGRLASIETLRNRKSEAESLYNQSLDMAQKAGSTGSDAATGEILRDYAKLMYQDSRYDDVKKMYDRFKSK